MKQKVIFQGAFSLDKIKVLGFLHPLGFRTGRRAGAVLSCVSRRRPRRSRPLSSFSLIQAGPGGFPQLTGRGGD